MNGTPVVPEPQVGPYRPELSVADMPRRILSLPIARGYPVPWFVEWIDGVPEFRAANPTKFVQAIQARRCWVCGERLGRHLAFVIGPMCAVNRTSSEPPCHYDCARWSAIHCPFLSRPHMVRREDAFSQEAVHSEGGLLRNPGCAGIWITSRFEVFKTSAAAMGALITMGPPERIEWFAEGRAATRAEVEASIAGGLPALQAMCEQERTAKDRQDAREALGSAVLALDAWLPTP